ncbi:hypothetical protein JHL17_14555 [Azospirillum sp. YIM B02556]|uniref:DUF4926 domain-containing protein n=1 Tax=Azospirillum endophyticum TaxID=2800326 RepID=A0ABS1F5S7_9PROT|nr:hypothetical protein [Azospirillum endophyticum]MBK1838637.1 hypothetical protein [Azospirillum endophyticum]
MDLTPGMLGGLTPEQEHLFESQLEQDDGAEMRRVLRAGVPVYYTRDDTPSGFVIKEYPDGRKELVDFSTGDELLVSALVE